MGFIRETRPSNNELQQLRRRRGILGPADGSGLVQVDQRQLLGRGDASSILSTDSGLHSASALLQFGRTCQPIILY